MDLLRYPHVHACQHVWLNDRVPNVLLGGIVPSVMAEMGMDKALTLALPVELQAAGLPVLIIWGEEDHLFPLDLGRRLRDAIGAKAQIAEIAQAKAFVMWDAPAECARAVAEFLDSAKLGSATLQKRA